MRKILCLFSVVLILALSAAPAFAASVDVRSSDPNNAAGDMSVPFDYVVLNDGSLPGYVCSWPAVSASSDGLSRRYTSNIGYFEYSYLSNRVSVNALFGDATSITLHRDFFVFSSDLASLEVSSSFDNINFVSVSLGGNALRVVPSSNTNRHVLEEVPFGITKTFDSIGSIDLGSIIEQAIFNSDMRNHYVAIENLNITLNFWVDNSGGENPTPELNFRSGALNQAGLMRSWFGHCNIKTIVDADSDFISWILPVLDNFLDFEIAPGLSVNTILYVLVVIGLALWFIKIMS